MHRYPILVLVISIIIAWHAEGKELGKGIPPLYLAMNLESDVQQVEDDSESPSSKPDIHKESIAPNLIMESLIEMFGMSEDDEEVFKFILNANLVASYKIVTSHRVFKSVLDAIPLSVCFSDYSDINFRQFIFNTAKQWEIAANMNLFNFPDIQVANCYGGEDIRIDLQTESKLSSEIGPAKKSCCDKEPTMFLGNLFASGSNMRGNEITYWILHEFGHALGYYHEHQRQELNCFSEYKQDEIINELCKKGWKIENIRANLKVLQNDLDIHSVRSVPDKYSVMMYTFDPYFYVDGEASECYASKNSSLSDTDVQFTRFQFGKSLADLGQNFTYMNKSLAEHSVAPNSVDKARMEILEALSKANVSESTKQKIHHIIGTPTHAR